MHPLYAKVPVQPIRTHLRYIERSYDSDLLLRLPDLPPALTWKQYRHRAGMGWRMLTALDLRVNCVMQIDDFVGVVTALHCTYAYYIEPIGASWNTDVPTHIEPEKRVGEVFVSLMSQRNGFACHYEAHLAPDWPVLVHVHR